MWDIVWQYLRMNQRGAAVKSIRGIMLPTKYRDIAKKRGTDPEVVRLQAMQAAEQYVQMVEALFDPDFEDPDED